MTVFRATGRLLEGNKDLVVFIVLMVLFRSSLADINHVPTGSMLPTIVEGDRIVINKLAYDIQLPLTNTKIFKFGDPKRGDIVVFNSQAADERLVKRVIGVPGDTVALINNRLVMNGAPLTYDITDSSDGVPVAEKNPVSGFFDLQERLFDVTHAVRLSSTPSFYSSFSPTTIPDGFYLVLGDNRDNSSDSRAIGLVPRHEIIGRSRSVMMSLNPDNYYLPRVSRFFKSLL